MMRRILAACSPGEVRVAVAHDGELEDYAIWRPGTPDGVGDLYRGRVTRRVTAMAGSFLALNGAEGFLPDSEGGSNLQEGDHVSVRVTRAAQGGKGPRLTALLGADEVPPARGQGALVELAQRYPDVPILVDDTALAARLKPLLGDRVSVVAKSFDEIVEEQVAPLAQPDIEVSSNGCRLHIHPTPALVAIDVDMGGAVAARRGKMAAHLAANTAILPILARQIRLRNLSGAILVDFAGLPVGRRSSLAPALRAALADDPLHPRLLGFTALGLAEIVRARVHPPLHELLAGPLAAGLYALCRIAEEIASAPHRPLALRAAPAIVAALKDDIEGLADLARRMGRRVKLHADPSLSPVGWMIEESDGST